MNGRPATRRSSSQTLRRLQSLMNAAGGRNLLERQKDTALTDLNVDIKNAVTKYQPYFLTSSLPYFHTSLLPYFSLRRREKARRDDHPLRLGSALIDLGRAYVAKQTLHGRSATVAGRRQNLHRFVGGLVRRL